MSAVEWIAAGFGVLSVWLGTRQSIAYWPTGLVNVALYIAVFYHARLYADMGLQAVYVVLCLYGWWAWLHGGASGHGRLPVSRVPRRRLAALLAAGAAFAGVLGWCLARHTDAALPGWDAATASYSLVAQWLTARKWIENWLLWIAVDVVYVGMYIVKQLYPTALLYAVFLVLAVRGWQEWRRSLEADAAAAAVAAA